MELQSRPEALAVELARHQNGDVKKQLHERQPRIAALSDKPALGTITAVPVTGPQVSSLQRLAGQGAAVLPQVRPKTLIPDSLPVTPGRDRPPKQPPTFQKATVHRCVRGQRQHQSPAPPHQCRQEGHHHSAASADAAREHGGVKATHGGAISGSSGHREEGRPAPAPGGPRENRLHGGAGPGDNGTLGRNPEQAPRAEEKKHSQPHLQRPPGGREETAGIQLSQHPPVPHSKRCEPKQRPRPHGEVPLWQAPLTPGRRRTGQGLPAIGASFCSPHYTGGPGVAGMAPALRPSLGLTCYTQSWAGPSSSSSTQATDTPGLGWRIGPHLTDLTCWPWAAREAGLDAGGLDSQPSRASDSQCGRSQALPQLQAPSTQHRACQLWLRASILGCTGPCLLRQPCPIAGPVPWWVRAMTRAETLTPIVPWGTASCHWAS
ncbi:PHD finger protein 21B isoform X3 [Manis javanica]|uniref:PHD finger protein 21B isoform X3 n=1 Tax=Manis javanica TaxID=9974 RepID=UPI003C6CE72B